MAQEIADHYSKNGEKKVDITFIEDLKVDTVIGIYDWERQIRQTISIDLEMGCDISLAAAEDTIDHCLDYKSVAKRIISFVEAAEYQTVETLAEKIAAIVREEFQVPWLRLKLSKPGAVRGSKNVGVLIERGKRAERGRRAERGEKPSETQYS